MSNDSAYSTIPSTNSSWTSSWTMARDVAVQAWPVTPNAPLLTMSTASSTLALGMTIAGFFPPISD
jgi:hypothetical protein